MTTALTQAAQDQLQSLPPDGICANSPEISTKTIGLGPNDKASIPAGRFYFYGDTRASATAFSPDANAFFGVVRDVRVAKCGNAGSVGGTSWQGDRDHLELLLDTPNPLLRYLLRLPAYQGQWSYRSLLGALQAVDLNAQAVKLEAKPGHTTTFIQVFLDPEGLQQVKAEAIGPDAADLQIAVDRLRRSLNLPPQFDEWTTAESQTPSPVINCEAC